MGYILGAGIPECAPTVRAPSQKPTAHAEAAPKTAQVKLNRFGRTLPAAFAEARGQGWGECSEPLDPGFRNRSGKEDPCIHPSQFSPSLPAGLLRAPQGAPGKADATLSDQFCALIPWVPLVCAPAPSSARTLKMGWLGWKLCVKVGGPTFSANYIAL